MDRVILFMIPRFVSGLIGTNNSWTFFEHLRQGWVTCGTRQTVTDKTDQVSLIGTDKTDWASLIGTDKTDWICLIGTDKIDWASLIGANWIYILIRT